MELEYINKPMLVKAAHFLSDGSNYDIVCDLVKLNGGHAELCYTDKEGRYMPNGAITTYRAILLGVGDQQLLVPRGCFVVIDGKDFFPVFEKDFLAAHVPLKDVNLVSNGDHTFEDLYKRISRWEPTLAEVLVTDKNSTKDLDPAVKQFIDETATVHTDSDGNRYHVLHGNVYILN